MQVKLKILLIKLVLGNVIKYQMDWQEECANICKNNKGSNEWPALPTINKKNLISNKISRIRKKNVEIEERTCLVWYKILVQAVRLPCEEFMKKLMKLILPLNLFLHCGFPVEYKLNPLFTIIYYLPSVNNKPNNQNAFKINQPCLHVNGLVSCNHRINYSIKYNVGYVRNRFNRTVSSFVLTNNKIHNNNRYVYEHEMWKGFDVTLERICSRCYRGFLISSSTYRYLTKDKCRYHWGKLRSAYSISMTEYRYYTCCNQGEFSIGCTEHEYHIWDGLIEGKINGPFCDFIKPKSRPKSMDPLLNKVLALDCEMFYTVKGLEVCKITIVNLNGDLIYNCLIKSFNRVVDYNTRYSGVSRDDFYNDNKNITIKTFNEAQNDLMNIIFKDTIIIGHGLENDFRVLKIVHKNVIDTTFVFPHFYGLPYKNSLKYLVRKYLNKDIQTNRLGHDSSEDAKACLELILWKLENNYDEI